MGVAFDASDVTFFAKMLETFHVCEWSNIPFKFGHQFLFPTWRKVAGSVVTT